MKKLLFIINPNSGKKKSKSDLIDALVSFSAHYQVEVYCTTKQLDCLQMIQNKGSLYDVIVVSGGDGTLNEAVNGLISCEKKPLLGYIPTGTMNDFSKNFDLTPSFEQTATKIVQNRTFKFDIGKINNYYFAYVAAFGAFTNVSYETQRELKENLGDIAYLLKGVSELPNLKPYHVKMKIDEQNYENDVLMGLIVNGYRVSGMDVIEKDDHLMNDGVFDLILVEWTDNLLEWIHYPIGLLKPNITAKFVKRIKAKDIEIDFDSPISWTLDGEKGEENTHFEVNNLPQALEILY